MSTLGPKDCREEGYISAYTAEWNPPEGVLAVAEELRKIKNSYHAFGEACGGLLRKSLDEVIDMPRTGRYAISQLEKTEKTYIGTKVEIMFRHELDLPKGEKLDLHICGREVDVKNTILSNWTIPREAVGEICILLQTDDLRSVFSVGLLRCDIELLSEGSNQDKKRTISRTGRQRVFWLIRDGNLPVNFFLHMEPGTRRHILSSASANERLVRLFLSHVGKPISRFVVESTAQQKDPMKRIRANGGAKDLLENAGYILLSPYRQKQEYAKELGKRGVAMPPGEAYFCFKKQ